MYFFIMHIQVYVAKNLMSQFLSKKYHVLLSQFYKKDRVLNL